MGISRAHVRWAGPALADMTESGLMGEDGGDGGGDGNT